jgi:hypothetical protein
MSRLIDPSIYRHSLMNLLNYRNYHAINGYLVEYFTPPLPSDQKNYLDKWKINYNFAIWTKQEE